MIKLKKPKAKALKKPKAKALKKPKAKALKKPKAKDLIKNHPYKIGQNYFIRTVTYFLTGKLTDVFEHELVIEDASWIPDTGRYSDSFKTGNHSEVEPVDGPIIVGRYAIIDCTEWNKELPRTQK